LNAVGYNDAERFSSRVQVFENVKLIWTENPRRVKIEVVSSKLFEQIKEGCRRSQK